MNVTGLQKLQATGFGIISAIGVPLNFSK